METGRVQTMEQAHRMAESSSRHDKPYGHISACAAMGHKCQKCNRDNHFASIRMGGPIKAERGRPTRPRETSGRHA
ncbi:hypothetical protein NDU88_001278 [Pleurodeles waltl]|uniref:Uncharacterized protein n=1 Tax=Pleurodeles waltl TaxID=8319 RepID=A0AAV7S9G2_PLEWA|nr:hypothetical protein NDU88_001278 [Pleurodeles waltl]